MTKKKIEDYFAEISNDTQVRPASSKYKNGVRIPFDSGYRVPNPVFNLEQQMALAEAAQRAAALSKTPDMYSQAVALDGREPAATPVEYTAPMNADQRVLAQLQALNGGLTPAIDPTVRVPDQIVNGLYPQAFAQSPQVKPPMADYPMGPTIEINRGAGQEPDPVFRPPQVSLANVLRDTAGSPVLSGNGNPIGLPNQSTGNVAGGKGGAGGK